MNFIYITVIVVIFLTSNAFAAISDFMITSEAHLGKYDLEGGEGYDESGETFLQDDIDNLIGNSEMSAEMLRQAFKQLMSDERYSDALYQAFPEHVIEQIMGPSEYESYQADYEQNACEDYNQQPSDMYLY